MCLNSYKIKFLLLFESNNGQNRSDKNIEFGNFVVLTKDCAQIVQVKKGAVDKDHAQSFLPNRFSLLLNLQRLDMT